MSLYGNYMDGVPVKISEKYKPPPRIELPYSIIENPSRAQAVADNSNYCFTFEENVISKIRELRNAKQIKKNERLHRLQLFEESKQKKLDLIAAAEAEEKLKQLSVSEVSYPSTEEISEISPDDKVEKHSESNVNNDIENETCRTIDGINGFNFNPCPLNSESQNILQPVPVQSHYLQNNLLDDPDPLQEIKLNTRLMKNTHHNSTMSQHNIEKLTFSDFESDTSSPFDNMELKTINDLELLAQVLQSQRELATNSNHNNCPPMANCAVGQPQMDGYTLIPNSYMDHSATDQGIIYQMPHSAIPNGYYVPTGEACDNTLPLDNVNLYAPNYQYYAPQNQFPQDTSYYGMNLPVNNIDTNETVGLHNSQIYNPQQFYYGYPQVPIPYTPTYSHSIQNSYNGEIISTEPSSSVSQNTIKSRSRSVPDIVKDLDNELKSARKRANERSCNASPAPKRSDPCPSSGNEKRSTKKKNQILPNPYDKLSMKLQHMCHRIHSMGFPLDRVARVCTLVGDNDKKVIEGLLMMGELLDLGFPEDKVSTALAKHEFNRDKALDELVS